MNGLLFVDRAGRFERLALMDAPAVASCVHGVLDVAPGTVRWFGNAVRSLVEHVGEACADEVSAQDVLSWRCELQGRLKPATVNSYLRAVRTMYARLVAAGVVATNPAAAVPYAPPAARRPQAMDPDTFDALCAAAERGATSTRDGAMLHTLYASGCRLSELLSMRLGGLEVWYERGRPAVAIEVVGKHRRRRPERARRFVYVDGDSAAVLCDWLSHHPRTRDEVFVTARGGQLTHNGFYSIWRRLSEGVEGVKHPHSLRHWFAVRKLDQGYDLPLVSAWLGHSDPAFTAAVYVVRREDQLRRAFFGA